MNGPLVITPAGRKHDVGLLQMVALVEGDNAEFFSIVDQVLKFRRSRDLQTLKYAKTVQAQPTAGSPRNIAVYAMFQLQARKRTQFAIHVIQLESGFGLWGVRKNRIGCYLRR